MPTLSNSLDNKFEKQLNKLHNKLTEVIDFLANIKEIGDLNRKSIAMLDKKKSTILSSKLRKTRYVSTALKKIPEKEKLLILWWNLLIIS